METLREFFQTSPEYFSLVLIGIGILIIVAAIRKWQWLTEGGDTKVFNNAWFISVFGERKLRIWYAIIGVLLILLGIVWYFIHTEFKGVI